MILLENVVKRYEMGPVSVTALDGISLAVDQGEFVVILGPSGSGKSTLLNMVSALDTPTSGRILVNDHDLSRTNQAEKFKFRRETIGFIFQTFNLFPTLTAVENVQFAIDVRGRGRGHSRANGHDRANGQAAAVLDSVGLAARMNHFPHELSGGEQQRVAIARALATGNPLLLADEPTGELDFQTGIQILTLLEAQAATGKTVLVVTHNREISRIADRVVELSSGHIEKDGPPRGGKAAIGDLHW
jgi:putative ABC transport system ATP-binding protein